MVEGLGLVVHLLLALALVEAAALALGCLVLVGSVIACLALWPFAGDERRGRRRKNLTRESFLTRRPKPSVPVPSVCVRGDPDTENETKS